jgi:hypothetical protein
VYNTNDDEVLGLDMKKLKVILSKSTGYTYLEAKVVKEHINALEEEFQRFWKIYNIHKHPEYMKKINKKNHIDLSARLHQIWAMIPLTAGMNARKEIKRLIDEIEKEKTPKQELLKLLEDCTCSLGTTDYDMFAEKVIDWMGDVKKKA